MKTDTIKWFEDRIATLQKDYDLIDFNLCQDEFGNITDFEIFKSKLLKGAKLCGYKEGLDFLLTREPKVSMYDLLKEMTERFNYLEGQSESVENDARRAELLLSMVRIQQIVLAELRAGKQANGPEEPDKELKS